MPRLDISAFTFSGEVCWGQLWPTPGDVAGSTGLATLLYCFPAGRSTSGTLTFELGHALKPVSRGTHRQT